MSNKNQNRKSSFMSIKEHRALIIHNVADSHERKIMLSILVEESASKGTQVK